MRVSATKYSTSMAISRSVWAVLSDLVKLRLTVLVVLTTLAGYYLGVQESGNHLLWFHLVLGTSLLAAGAAVLNQYLEGEFDALMPRTSSRPIPAGEISAGQALVLGGVLSVLGLGQLACFVNYLSCLLGALTLVLYLAVYTPLKRVTVCNTLVGAVPGALPPLMGWLAARGTFDALGWILFGILLLWQLPHFLAIAWLYRDQYAAAGFVMLPGVDPSGSRTGRTAFWTTAILLPVSLTPSLLGAVGAWYLAGAAALSLAFIFFADQFARLRDDRSARRLFLYSILYLPVLMGLMVVDKAN